MEKGHFLKIFTLMTLGAVSNAAHAACLSQTSGPIVLQVASCASLDPKEGSASFKSLPDWVQNLPPNLKANILESHRGLLLDGKVTDSSAVTTNDRTTKFALKGQNVKVFLHATFKMSCESLKSKLLGGIIGESCCDGGSQAPCLWSTPYYLKAPKIASAPAMQRSATIPDSIWEKTIALNYKKRQYQKIIDLLYPKWSEYRKDVETIWYLTQSLKKKDQCREAIPILEDLNDQYNKQSLSLQHEKKIVDSVYLLTRCYAKTGKPDEAIAILEGMRLNQKLYGSQLRDSRRNPDFKPLRANKSFQAYVEKIK